MNVSALNDWQVNTVANSFSKAAQQYDTAARLQRSVGSILFEKIKDDLNNNQIVLDVGAGTGFCTELLASRSNVIALDIAPAMLIQGRKRLGKTVDYIAADTHSIAIQDHSVDIVFANLVLQWCTDVAAAFKEFRRILKVNGQVVFSTLGPQTLWELRAAWEKVDQYRHVNDFQQVHEFEKYIEQTGFVGSLDSRVIQLEYSSPMHLMLEIKTLGAVNMSESRQRGLTGKKRLRQVCEEYNKLMDQSMTHATWDVVLACLRPAQYLNE